MKGYKLSGYYDSVESRDKDIVSRYLRGESVKDIRFSTHYSPTTIYRILENYNVERNGNLVFRDKERKKIVKLYNLGLSINNIMKLMDVKSEHTIYRILKEMGCKLRQR